VWFFARVKRHKEGGADLKRGLSERSSSAPVLLDFDLFTSPRCGFAEMGPVPMLLISGEVYAFFLHLCRFSKEAGE